MGGGEFEYNPDILEGKITRRSKYLEDEFEAINKRINEGALNYMKLGLGTLEGYKEYILRELIKDFRSWVNGKIHLLSLWKRSKNKTC